MGAISRAEFLRGNWRARTPAIRPPWALPEDIFKQRCDSCEKCVSACSENIIQLSPTGLPGLNFEQGSCTFCGQCEVACSREALNLSLHAAATPLPVRAQISDNCLAMKGISCMRCLEACEHEAIVAKPALGGRMQISVMQANCNGCGACVAPCPVAAIAMTMPENQTSPPMVGDAHLTGETHEQ